MLSRLAKLNKALGIAIVVSGLAFAAALIFNSGVPAAGSPAAAPTNQVITLNTPPAPAAPQPDQFYTLTKDGVEIACPKQWQTYSSDSSLIYEVSLVDTIRITVGVLPADSQSYYDGLVKQGAVYLTTIAGNPAYRNDYTYGWNGHRLTDICVSVVKSGKACHFMFLCDTSEMPTYQPIFDYVLDSLKFL